MNPLKGEVSFLVGEETFTVVYDIDTLCVLERAVDLSIMEIVDKMGRLPLWLARQMLLAGLREKHPDITLPVVDRIIRTLKIEGVLNVVAEAIRIAFPTPGPEAAKGAGDPPPAG